VSALPFPPEPPAALAGPSLDPRHSLSQALADVPVELSETEERSWSRQISFTVFCPTVSGPES